MDEVIRNNVNSQISVDSPAILTYSDENWNLLKYEIENTYIQKNTIIDSRPFESDDFTSAPDTAKACFKKLKSIFCDAEVERCECSESCSECIHRAIVLCGEHSSKNLWSNDECVNLSKEVLNSILKSCKCGSLNAYLMKSNHHGRSNVTELFTFILPKLSKNEWKYYPSITCCFGWLLHHIQVPYMKQFVHMVLPISLNIMEDYATVSKEIGLECLYHIITNISAAELQWHIQIELLQNILKRLLYYRETELIIPTISCALDIAEKSQPNLKHTVVNLKWSYYDEILSIALPLIEFEQHMERRQKYSQGLCLILKSNNFSVVRWLPRILRIIDDYSKTPVTELEAIMALNLFLRVCWPVADKHWKRINVIAGKIIFSSDNVEAVKHAELCIYLLKQIVPSDATVMDIETIKSRRIECK